MVVLAGDIGERNVWRAGTLPAAADYIESTLSAAGYRDVRLTPVDETVNLGSLDAAAAFLSKMGPAARLLREASEAERAAAITAMRAALEPYVTNTGVVMPAAFWVVEATA